MKEYLLKSQTKRLLSQLGEILGIENPFSMDRLLLESKLRGFTYHTLVHTLKQLT